LALTYGGRAFLSGVNRYPWGHWFQAGPLHPLFVVFLFGLLIAGTGQLLARSRFLEDENAKRLARRVFWAFVIGGLGSIDLFADYGFNIRPWGALPVSIAVLLLTHLVLFEGLMGVPTIDPGAHHRLLDFFSSLAPFQEQTADIANGTQLTEGQKVLDVACGTGALREALASHAVAYVGFDGNESALTAARAKFPEAPPAWVHGDPGRSWPFEDKVFDRVFLVNPLAFVGMGNPAFLLSEAARVIKTDGEVLVLGRTGGSFLRGLFAADLESAWARGGAAAVAREFLRVGPRLFRLAYELLVLTRERPPQALVDMNVNELLAALRQSGFTPGRVKKTRHSPHVLVTARPAAPVAAPPRAGASARSRGPGPGGCRGRSALFYRRGAARALPPEHAPDGPACARRGLPRRRGGGEGIDPSGGGPRALPLSGERRPQLGVRFGPARQGRQRGHGPRPHEPHFGSERGTRLRRD
jgi:SAM-dependent methyltransferase